MPTATYSSSLSMNLIRYIIRYIRKTSSSYLFVHTPDSACAHEGHRKDEQVRKARHALCRDSRERRTPDWANKLSVEHMLDGEVHTLRLLGSGAFSSVSSICMLFSEIWYSSVGPKPFTGHKRDCAVVQDQEVRVFEDGADKVALRLGSWVSLPRCP